MTGTFAAGTALTFTIYQQTRSTAWISATMLLLRSLGFEKVTVVFEQSPAT
jgi:hypothetical protein